MKRQQRLAVGTRPGDRRHSPLTGLAGRADAADHNRPDRPVDMRTGKGR